MGDIKYRDLNGDGVINADDQGMISEYGGNPRIQYGFGLNINYKKFDLGVFFNGSAMRKIMLTGIHPFGESDYNIFKFVAKDYWTEANPNPNAAYPRLGLQKQTQTITLYRVHSGCVMVIFTFQDVGNRISFLQIR